MSTRNPPTSWQFLVKRKLVAVEVKERMRATSFMVLRDLAVAGHRASAGVLRRLQPSVGEPGPLPG